MPSRDAYSILDLSNRKRMFRTLDLRAPAYPLSVDDDEAGASSPKIDRHIAAYLDAWDSGDRDEQIEAAKGIVYETVGFNKLRGVPIFAHPVVPRHFIETMRNEVDKAPAHEQAAMVKDIVDTFEPSAKPGVAQQFAAYVPTAAAGADAIRNVSGGASASALLPALSGGMPRVAAGGVKHAQPQKTGSPWPPVPRPHPLQAQRDQERLQKCKKILRDWRGENYAIEFFERELQQYENNLRELEASNQARLNYRQQILRKLAEVRSRSTEPPPGMFDLPLPKPRPEGPPGPEIFSEIVREGIKEKAKEQYRRQAEGAKANEIARLEEDLRNLDRSMAPLNTAIAAKKAQIKQRLEYLGNLGMGERRLHDEFEALGCRAAGVE